MFEVPINFIPCQSVMFNFIVFVSMRILSSSSTVLLVRHSSSIIWAVDETTGPTGEITGDCSAHCFLILNNKTQQSSKRLGNRRSNI